MKPTLCFPFAAQLALLLLPLFLAPGALGQTTLVTENFDTDGEGTRYTSSTFDDGGSDYFERQTTYPDPRHLATFTITAPQSGGYWSSEDIGSPASSDSDNPLGTHGIVRLNNVAIAGFNNLKVRVFLAQTDTRFDIEDILEIQVAVDGNLPGTPTNLTQGTYTTVGRFIGNAPDIFDSTDMKQDADLDGVVSGDGDDTGSPVLTTTFTEYVFNVPFTGNNMSVQYRLEQNGGSEEIGLDHIRVEGTVSANNAPVLASIEAAAIMYTEGDVATQISSTITVSDADAGDMIESTTIQITANNDPTEDVLAVGTPPGGTVVNFTAAIGTLTITGPASLAAYQTALRSVTYQNTDAVNPSTATRTVQFQVNDGTDNSNFQSRNVQITSTIVSSTIPHLEELDTDGEGARYTSSTYRAGTGDFFERSTTNPATDHSGPFTFTAPQGGAFWASEDINNAGNPLGDHGILRLQNLDSTGLSSLQVHLYLAELAALSESDDKIEIQYAFDGNIPVNPTDLSSGNYTTFGRFVPDSPDVFTEGAMKLDSDLDGVTNGDPEDVASPILTSMMTEFTFDIPVTGNTLSVQIRIQQEGGSEELAFDHIRVTGSAAVGTPPVLANIEGAPLGFTEGDPATQVSGTITVSDPDPSDIASATVQITGNYVMGQDVLGDDGGVPAAITVSLFDAATGTLNLTGSASVADYQTALRAITYVNTNGTNPSAATRTVSFQATDGDGNPSNFQTRDIEVTPTIDPGTVPHLEDFETDGDGVRYTSNSFNTGGPVSFFERVTANPDPRHNVAGFFGFTFTPPQGGAYFAGEDIENPANALGDHGIIRLRDLDVTGATGLKVQVFLAETAPNGEADDKIEIQYAFDGDSGGVDLTSGTYTTIGRFVPDSPDNSTTGAMTLDRDLDGMTNLDAVDDAPAEKLSQTMQEFVFDIPGTGNLLSIQVRVDQNGGSEEIAFDHIRVTANQPPVITLPGPDPQEVECGDPYTELGATANDPEDGDISDDIVIDSSAVDTSTPGDYTVTYNVTDSSGAAATEVTRTVNVVDTTPPVITLVGANPQVIESPAPYVELGATASDTCDLGLGSVVIDASAVDTSTPGSYSVTYNISDASGNPAAEMTRTVNVVDTIPTISSIDNLTVTLGAIIPAIRFDISDAEDAAGSLTVTASSNVQGVIPNANIGFLGTGGTRFLQLTPTGAGTATITVTVQDTTGGSSNKTFDLTVDDAPTIALSRNLPQFYLPGIPIRVSITATPGGGVTIYTVTETDFPVGWSAPSNISDGGTIVSGDIVWSDISGSRFLTYLITPPGGAPPAPRPLMEKPMITAPPATASSSPSEATSALTPPPPSPMPSGQESSTPSAIRKTIPTATG